jgi:hypothetical protein
VLFDDEATAESPAWSPFGATPATQVVPEIPTGAGRPDHGYGFDVGRDEPDRTPPQADRPGPEPTPARRGEGVAHTRHSRAFAVVMLLVPVALIAAGVVLLLAGGIGGGGGGTGGSSDRTVDVPVTTQPGTDGGSGGNGSDGNGSGGTVVPPTLPTAGDPARAATAIALLAMKAIADEPGWLDALDAEDELRPLTDQLQGVARPRTSLAEALLVLPTRPDAYRVLVAVAVGSAATADRPAAAYSGCAWISVTTTAVTESEPIATFQAEETWPLAAGRWQDIRDGCRASV